MTVAAFAAALIISTPWSSGRAARMQLPPPFSEVVCEPLAGKEAIIPIGTDFFYAVTGYRAAVGGMLAVHEAMPEESDTLLRFDMTVFLPARSASL